MQAAGFSFSSALLPLKNTRSLLIPSSPSSLRQKTKKSKSALTMVAAGGDSGGSDSSAASAVDSVVDYSSLGSVFPAEARETIGGESSGAAIYPEAKLTASKNPAEAASAVEEVDREYLDYNQQNTVFPDEACDDLGGEFCDPEYQIGVGKKSSA